MSHNNTSISSGATLFTISPFKLAAVNESLAMLPGQLSVEASDGWTSSDGKGQALAIRSAEQNDMKFLPVVHASEFTDDMTPSQIAEKIFSAYSEEVSTIDFTKNPTSKDYVLSHIVPRIVNAEKAENAEASGIITEHFMGNLYVYWTVLIKDDGDEQVSYSLDNKNLDSVGLTIEQIKTAALENIRDTVEISPIEDVLGLAGDDEPVGSTFFVATNKRRHYGAAAVLLQRDILDAQEKKLGSFHIIPSSVHEVLIVPDTLHISAPELKDMLVDVNSSVVQDKDILDDQVYQYSNGRLSVVD